MIKRQLRVFAVVVLALASLLLIVYKQYFFAQSEFENRKALQQLSQQISSINLEFASEGQALNSRQGLSALLQRLDSTPQVAFWQLKDNESIIDSKVGELPKQLEIIKHTAYISAGSGKNSGKIYSLEVYLISEASSSGWISLAEILALAVFSSVIIAFVLWKFHWLLELEQASTAFLEQSRTDFSFSPSAKNNSIYRTLIHLFKSNQSLLKDKKALTDQIRKTNYVDHVTELGNKAFFKAEFQVRLFHHDSPESGLLILFNFVEEDYEGNIVLNDARAVQVAGVLKKFSQNYSDSLVARLNTTEFVLLTPNQAQKDVDLLCRQIITQLEKLVFDKSSIKEHFVDIGISVYQQGFDYYKVMAEADMALRNAQLQGGNSWFMYGEALPVSKVRGHLKWRSFLQRILDKRQIRLYGQRIVYFDNSEIQHQEIFARIEDGDEVLTADTFLPMASRCGLAADFDRQVVDSLIKHCLHSEQDISQQRFAVNLFISSLFDERFVGWLIGKLSSFPELCKHFVFEIKEAHVIERTNELKPIMEQISKIGATWCIERFGEPDANLDYLEHLPISMVKIDRRIIHQIAKSSRRQLLVSSLLINLSSHGIMAFAEGVEEAEDAAFLKEMDIKGAQGFYFSKPRHIGGVQKLLKAI